jgi:ADP-ribose pyrophosphatase YjhB (NUDIX family)
VRKTQSTFTVSAAAIIFNEKKEVLLLNHVLRPYSGWGIPGGFIEKSEQAEDAVRREIREETGIELSRLKLYTIRTLGTHLEILFFATADGEPQIRSAEIIEAKWYAPSDLPEDVVRVHGKHIEDAMKKHDNS